MSISNPKLWHDLKTYAFDQPDVAFPFSERLARENGWPLDYARRAIEEYRRFLYLAATSREPMTPSDEVDQVWHLHLSYSRDYWDHLCGEVLKRPLHHGPTNGGAEEAEKYFDWYDKTKARYASEFDAPAPLDIWPPAEIRFTAPRGFKRINTSNYLLIPNTMDWGYWLRSFALGGVFCLIMLTAFKAAAAQDWQPVLDVLVQYSPYEIALVLIVAVGAFQLLLHRLFRLISKDKNPAKRDGGGCNGAGMGCGGGCGGCGG